jgi:hypothetical protein
VKPEQCSAASVSYSHLLHPRRIRGHARNERITTHHARSQTAHAAPQSRFLFSRARRRKCRRRPALSAADDGSRELAAVRKAARILLEDPSAEPLFDRILRTLRETIDADAYSLWRHHPDGMWRIEASDNLSAEYLAGSIPANRPTINLDQGAFFIHDVR